MDKEMKRRIRITAIGLFGLIMVVVGVSYASFNSSIAGLEVQTVGTGCLKVDMTDTGALSLTNKAPETDESGLSGTPYTFTLTNTCSVDASYLTTINVLNTSNLENLSKVKIALNGDSYLAPTFEGSLPETALVDPSETTVSKTYKLDEGHLTKGESKTFELRTWIDYDVEEITGSLENKIIVLSEAKEGEAIEYNTSTAAYYVLSQNEISKNPSYKEIAPSATQTSGAIITGEEGNRKYYFRGNPNNYFTFAGKSWRVLSTNSDGSINLVLNSIYSNQTYTNVAANLTSFYSTISSEEKYIKTDQTFCSETYSGSTYYATSRVTSKSPANTCQSGNYLTKVGLVTADDLMYAGAVAGKANTSFYLAASSSYFTASHNSSSQMYGYTTGNSLTNIAKTTSSGVKPVITLKADTMISGKGTSETPFYVSGIFNEEVKYIDNVAPTIMYARSDNRWTNFNKQIEISATDNVQGSGIAGYIVTTSSTKPSASATGWEATTFQKYDTINTYDNGTYYVFAKDANGNVSEGKKVIVEHVDKTNPTCTVQINPGTDTTNKTLVITSTDVNIDETGYSWADTEEKTASRKISENGVYTATISDLAGNKGTCSAVVTTITD